MPRSPIYDGEAQDFDASKRADREKRQALAGLQAEAEKLAFRW